MIKIIEWGTGRKDYSENVEEAVVSITRSHQYRYYESWGDDLSAYWFITIDTEDIYGVIGSILLYPRRPYDFFIYTARVEYDANVLIKAYFGFYNMDTGVFYPKQVKFGYESVEFIFPRGMLMAKEECPPLYPTLAYLPGGYKIRGVTSFIEDRIAP